MKKYPSKEIILSKIISIALNKQKEDIIKKITEVKEAIQRTGTFKYDDCYDDCIKIVEKINI